MSPATRRCTSNDDGTRTYNYYIFSYIGNLLYRFTFTINRTCDNMIRADLVRGNLHIQVEEITPSMYLPPNGVNKWVQI
jgi:hypothetical protein